ncbi:MAG: hypothetical protein SFX73_38025 [Kofleriaceae bacterium]|nr:hypothetical protein [Kofleriaceae bacterium]
MPITLAEDSERIADVCRKAEAACTALPTTHAWPASLLEHFRDVPEAQVAPSYATTPAAFRKSDASIYVNAETFFAMSEDEQLAVVVHEVGHAVLPDGDCFDADMFACRYGQEAALVAERTKHFGGASGAEYAAALAQWRDPSSARAAYSRWRARKLAGVV